MFGIALTTLLGYAAAFSGGVVSSIWLHGKWTQVRTQAENEKASILARLAAVEAAIKPPRTPL